MSKQITDAERLRAAFGNRSQAQFVRETDFKGGASMVSQHLSGNRPINLASAKKYADWLNVSIEDISPSAAAALAALTPSAAERYLAQNQYHPIGVSDEQHHYGLSIRKVKLRLSAGISGFSIENEIEDDQPITFKKSWFDKRGFIPEKLLALKVKGESMEPTLYDGDTVVINTMDTTPIDGDVFAINYEGEPVVKRLVRDLGQWWVTSDNPDQRRFSKKVCQDNSCIIIGKIVHKQSDRI